MIFFSVPALSRGEKAWARGHIWIRLLGVSTTLLVLGGSVCGCREGGTDLPSEARKRLATHLVGMKVETNAGEQLGSVQDLLLDVRAGRVKYVVVGSEGIPGDSRAKIVPPEALFLGTVKRDTLALDVRKDVWSKAPLFLENSTLMAKNEPEIRRFFEAQSTNTGLPAVAARSNGGLRLSPVGRGEGRLDFSGEVSPLTPASDLIGKPLLNGQSQRLGEVQDLLVDFPGGKLALVIVVTDEPIAGAKQFALPLSHVQRGLPESLVADVAWEAFRHAATLDFSRWGQLDGSSPPVIFRFEARALRLESRL